MYPDIVPGDRQHVAEDEAEQIDRVAALPAYDEDSQGEASQEDYTDRSIVADESPAGDECDGQGGKQSGHRAAELQIEPQYEGDGHTAEAGVRQGIADEGHPLENDEAPHDGGNHADQGGSDQGPLHELAGEGLRHEVQGLTYGRHIPCPPR